MRRRGVWPVVVLMLVAVGLPAAGALGLAGPVREMAETLRTDTPWWAWPAFVAAGGLAVGLAILPTHAMSLAAGYVFGLTGGLASAVALVVGGTLVGHAAARRLSAGRLRDLIDRTSAGRTLARSLIDTTGHRATLAVALVRLPPQVPFALGNVAAAGAGVWTWPLLVGTTLGMFPRVAIVVWLGDRLGTWDPATTPAWSLPVAIGAGVVGLGGIGLWSWRILRRLAVTD